MATVKMTFSLDEQTANRLNRTAEQLSIPKSQVVREAIADYSARADRLSPSERDRLLEAFDRLVPKIPPRPQEEVEVELAAIREARRNWRGGGRD
jgi:predicted transcriptional regulator